MRKILVTLCLLASLWGAKARGQAANVYVTQTGSSSGACTSSVQSAAWFNTATNWGTGGTQIGPATIVHLCGTFTGAVNTTMLTVQASGTSGNPITMLLDTGAVFTSPMWAYTTGAINVNGASFVTVDGGTNGLIKNTANGVGLANNTNSAGVVGGSGSNVTVKNLTISNLYVAIQDQIATGTSCTFVPDSTAIGVDGSNALVTNNTIDHSRIGIHAAWGVGVSNVEWSFNTLTFVQHGLYGGARDANADTLAGLKIHDNDIGGGAYLWDTSANCYHHDPIHLFLSTAGQVTSGVQIYNNYIHGLWSNDSAYGATHITAMIFLETIGPSTQVFNNVIELDAGAYNYGANGAIFPKGSGTASVSSADALIVNNTIVSNNGGTFPVEFQSNLGGIFKNNVVTGFNSGPYTPSSEATSTQASDFNDIYGVVGNNWGAFDSLSGWQSHSQDVTGHSVFTNPNLSSSYTLNALSPAIGIGTNLTSLGITLLDSDKNGHARPGGSTAWDAGAYNYAAGAPATPTNISIVVVGP